MQSAEDSSWLAGGLCSCLVLALLVRFGHLLCSLMSSYDATAASSLVLDQQNSERLSPLVEAREKDFCGDSAGQYDPSGGEVRITVKTIRATESWDLLGGG